MSVAWVKKKEEIELAVNSTHSELISLLKHAHLRGLSTLESFKHFDRLGDGFVDVDALIDGLARLGISISQPVADSLLDRISNGTVFFTLSDFERFLKESSDIDLEQKQPTKVDAKPKDKSLKNASRMFPSRRRSENLSPNQSITIVNQRAAALTANPLSTTNNDDTSSALPLPDDAYTHGLNRESKKKFSLHLRRHRVAYKELSKDGTRSVKKTTKKVNKVVDKIIESMSSDKTLLSQVSLGGNCPDEFFHVENGCVMTYRVTTGTIVEDYSYTIVVVPDLFMTLDTLQENLRDISIKYIGASIVLIGLLGLPNTTWTTGLLLDSALHCRCILSLLIHLHNNSRLLKSSDDSIILIGFGTGGFYLSHLCANYLSTVPFLSRSIKALCLVNSFIRMSKLMRNTLQELYDALQGLGSAEMHQLLCGLHFSDDYLTAVGRVEAMNIFWNTRHQKEGLIEGSQFTGVMKLLHGLLVSSEGSDEATLLSSFIHPIIVLQATESVFISPKAMEQLYTENLLPDTRFLVESISELKTGAIHIQWLKSGHEVIQERSNYIASLIGALGEKFRSIAPVEYIPLSPRILVLDEKDNEFDASENIEEDGEESYTEYSEHEMIEEEKVELIESDYDDDDDDDDDDVLEEAAASEVEEGPEYAESMRRKQLRVARIKAAERAADLEFARRIMLQDSIAEQERNECFRMEREDIRSRLVADYIAHAAFMERSADHARDLSVELKKLQRAEALREVESQIALKRAFRVEERRLKAEAILHDIESESMLLTGEQSGGYEASDFSNVIVLIETTKRLFGDYLECRQKSVQSLKRHNIMEEKIEVFKDHSRAMLADVRKLRKALRLAQTNPGLVSDRRNNDISSDVLKLQNNLNRRELDYNEFAVMTKQREEQFAAATRNFQRFKIKLKELEIKMETRLTAMHDLDIRQTRQLKLVRCDKEELVLQKVKLVYKKNTLSHRKESLAKEQERIQNHAGHFIDTDLWIEGVLQRCVTKELRRHFRREFELSDLELQRVESELSLVRGKIVQCSENLQKIERDCQRVSLAFTLFGQKFNQLKQISIKASADKLSKMYDTAELKESASYENREAEMQAASNSHIDRIRQKDTESRTNDEKKIIAIDALVYPENYNDITTREAEEMQLDTMYTTELSKTDLDRIMRLPEKVSLAVPFLHCKADIEAHRLVNKYYRDKDENYFINQDYHCESHGYESNSSLSNENGRLFTSEDLQVAEGIHEMLLRESKRDRLRTCNNIDNLTDEEQQWISIDKILNPEIYCDDNECDSDDELNMNSANRRFFLTSNVLNGKLAGVNKKKRSQSSTATELLLQNNDGDKYNEMRNDYDEGNTVFEEVKWKCSFTREYILKLRSNLAIEEANDDEKRVKYLLAKYYVSEDESMLGHERLNILKNIATQINAIPQIKYTASEAEDDCAVTDGVGNMDSLNKEFWGSWEQVHPASASPASQQEFFSKHSYSATRDHPASYAITEVVNSSNDELFKLPISTETDLTTSALNTLETTNIKNNNFASVENDPNSEWYIVNSLDELAVKDKQTVGGKIVLVTRQDTPTIFEITDASLQSRQSRAHYFTITDSDSVRVLDLTVSIIFQGCFGDRGYKLGRLAASLFKLPNDKDKSTNPLPRSVGYTPYELIVPNSPNTLGRIVIRHNPRVKPLQPGSYQIVIGAAAYTKYSIEVHCRSARAALPLLDEEIQTAKEMQARLPLCLRELENLTMSIRLTERKFDLCSKMIIAADNESKKIQRRMRTVTTALEVDDEEMLMREDERRELQREISILEIEFTEWVAVFGSRCKEKASIKEGIDLMQESNIKKLKERSHLKEQLSRYRNILPLCLDLLRDVREAANLSIDLNSHHKFETFDMPSGQDVSVLNQTPADRIRGLYKLKGWRGLSIEEQQWTILDQELHPHLYDIQREKEDEENNKRLAAGKRIKKKKISAAVEAVRFSKVEIEHLRSRPFGMLTRKEALARKLLVKYHDEKDYLRQKRVEVAYGFDSHLAERVRSKAYQTYSKEEKEWSSIDRVLHPEVWSYYSHGHIDTEMTQHANRPDANSTAPNEAVNQLNDIRKILGFEDTVDALASDHVVDGKLDVRAAVDSTQKSLVHISDGSVPWVCSLSKDEIIRIWKQPKDALVTVDEKHIFRLLHKYNGAFTLNNEGNKKTKSDGSNHRIQFGASRNVISSDPDIRCHRLLQEIDRASTSKLKLLDSDQLHSSNQRFPPDVLRLQLETALDRELTEQILERERDEHYKGLTDSESENSTEEVLSDASEDGGSRLGTAAGGRSDGRSELRAGRRKQRNRVMKKNDFATDVVRTTNFLMNRKAVSSLQLEDSKLLREIGSVGLCLACRTKGCQWEETVDVVALRHRMEVLQVEIERVKFDKESKVMTSLIALSALQGGNPKFRRKDLLAEITAEYSDLERRIQLSAIDKELHDAHATREAFIEVRHLHGYATMLSTVNARIALTAARARLIAMSTAREIVDDILDWMLEGWQFGERQSTFRVMGYVPSIKTDGLILAGQDQIKAANASVDKARYRMDIKRSGKLLPISLIGTNKEKSGAIDVLAVNRIEENKVAKVGSDHEKLLNETESTLRFGEQKSWSGQGDDMKSAAAKAITQERMRMIEENTKVGARKKRLDAIALRCKIGEQRRKEREDAERKESLMKLQAVVRRQKLEAACVGLIQKVYRGHLSRKAVKRWAFKKAELAAMFAVLNSTAIYLQRIWRGYVGRMLTIQKRQEMSHFIALMRQQEAEDDEFVYWESHPWSKFKRDLRRRFGKEVKEDYEEALAHHLQQLEKAD